MPQLEDPCLRGATLAILIFLFKTKVLMSDHFIVCNVARILWNALTQIV